MNKYYTYILNNGLKILLVPTNDINIINYNINIKIGHDIETIKTLEISHFLEHLMTLYTSPKYPCGAKNREFFSYNNISENAETDDKNIICRLEFQNKFLEIVCDYIINSLLYFKIDKNIFENEKNSVIEELNEIIADTNYDFETAINSILYKNHQRSINQNLRLQNTKKITINNIINFYKKNINPKNIVISFVGNFNKTKLLNILKKLDVPSFTGNEVKYKLVPIKLSNNIFYYKNDKDICNVKFIFKIPYTFFDDEYYTIYGLLDILTIDLNSIILKKLRSTEGLIYDLDSSMDLDEVDKNLSIVMFSTSVNSKNLLKVIQFLIEIFNNIKNNYIKKKYITKYIESINIRKQKHEFQKNPEQLLNEYSKYLLWNKKIFTLTHEYKCFSNVNKDNLKTIANKIFDFKNLLICYDGKNNINNKIKKFL